jgi:hypothetical protein
MANGYILHESKTKVSIMTLESANQKTGNMAQVWILARNIDPVTATGCGLDKLVCGQCKHRPVNNGSCYVQLDRAPNQVFKSFQNRSYPAIGNLTINKSVRFGAYGDPAFIPQATLKKLAESAKGFTGYTHQWKHCPRSYRRYVMASVDNLEEKRQAIKKGYRTFRVSLDGIHDKDEILCLNSSHGIQCADCLLCSGTSKPRAKNIVIKVHGHSASKFRA